MEQTKKNVSPVLKNMEIGDSELFSSVQRLTVEGTRHRIQRQFPPKKFSVLKVDDYSMCVTRVA